MVYELILMFLMLGLCCMVFVSLVIMCLYSVVKF